MPHFGLGQSPPKTAQERIEELEVENARLREIIAVQQAALVEMREGMV